MLGIAGGDWREGDALPFGWHFPLLGAETPRADLRADGFPGLGLPMPDLSGRRLVAAGRTVECRGVLRIGQVLDRTSRIATVEPRSTRQGLLTTVTVEHEISDCSEARVLIKEAQTFLLFDAPFTAQPVPAEDCAEQSILKSVTPDETMLFHYSALAFNSHKIHLDRDHAREVEGYPDLVVNGGLATLLLTEIARARFGETISRLAIRHRSPLFCNRPIRFAEADREEHVLRAIDEAGRVAAEMEFAVDGI